MQYDRQALREEREVFVRGEDGQIAPYGHRADEEVGVGGLHPLGSAEIVEFGRRHVVLSEQQQVWEGVKVRRETLELCLVPHPGQDLLTNGADELDHMGGDKPPQFRGFGILGVFVSSQGQGPDVRVHQDLHSFARCCL